MNGCTIPDCLDNARCDIFCELTLLLYSYITNLPLHRNSIICGPLQNFAKNLLRNFKLLCSHNTVIYYFIKMFPDQEYTSEVFKTIMNCKAYIRWIVFGKL